MTITDLLQIYSEGATNLLHQILNPSYRSSWWMLIGVSLLVWGLENIKPWRSEQRPMRKDFWLDAFYMFFNFFFAPWLFLNLFFHIGNGIFSPFLEALPKLSVTQWPQWQQILLIFLLQDFCHYWIHRLLHRVPFLWRYHKVHHSVEQMGFAAHLRYHWMENVVYRSLGALPFFMLGFSPLDLYWVHLITLLIGHLNHSNLDLTYGPFRWILNHPTMHLWHHAEEIPKGFRYGVNYGISLSIWDVIFRSGVWEKPPRDLKLGFAGRENFPNDFVGQNLNLRGPSPLSEDPSA